MKNATPITPAQQEALDQFKAKHGKDWKEALKIAWLNASEPGALQRLRNTRGFEWLNAQPE